MKDEELKLALDELMEEYDMVSSSFAKRVDEIFKQALAAPVQEPVAWWITQMDMDGKIDSFAVTSDYDYAKSVCDLDIAAPRPLVFGDDTPPAAQRQWVGLTDQDKLHIEIMGGKSDVMLAEMVEAKLKERNV